MIILQIAGGFEVLFDFLKGMGEDSGDMDAGRSSGTRTKRERTRI
jgi:hypothetical protein